MPTGSDNWLYETFPLDTSAETFDAFSPLVHLWRAKAINGPLPSWKSFQMRDFTGWLGFVNMLEVTEWQPMTIRHRLWGTFYSTVFGVDLTWRDLRPGMYGFDEADFDFLRGLMDAPGIGRWQGPIDLNGGGVLDLHLLSLPLSAEGGRVSQVVTVGRVPGRHPHSVSRPLGSGR